MHRTTDATVLMVGPDRSLRGGIVSVVDGYFNAGLSNMCGKCDYLGTGFGTNLASKSIAFARALITYERILDSYEMVHLHMGPRGSYRRKSIMARIAKRHGKKIILHEHSGEFARDFEEGDESYRSNVRHTFSIADRVIVLSEEWRDYFSEYICDKSKIEVLHNGVELPKMKCSPDKNTDVLFLGRLGTRKSPDVLLRASREILRAFPEMRLIFGGDGDINYYRMLAQELDILNQCEFLGWVSGEEKEKLFSRAGIYCLPSKHEGMPMSVLEAMAHGIPTISTRVGGVPQIIQSGVNGLLFDPDNETELACLLAKLVRSPSLREKIGLEGHRTIEDCFSVQVTVQKLVSIYKTVYNQ